MCLRACLGEPKKQSDTKRRKLMQAIRDTFIFAQEITSESHPKGFSDTDDCLKAMPHPHRDFALTDGKILPK